MSAETIVALATPRGTSAIAVVRASGDLSFQVFQELYGANIRTREVFYFKYFTIDGELVDDVLGIFFRGPNSYTGEDSFEIFCHGNMLIVEQILSDLAQRGCRFASPGEFTKRAFLNGKLDLCQAEAVADVIHASNVRAVRVAQNQLAGRLSDGIDALNKRLLSILANVEAQIDFSENEDEIPFNISIEIEKLTQQIADLIDSSRHRNRLNDGIATVILGAPNAGKSSLLNFLLNEERAIVSDVAGTTRDIISERIKIGQYMLKISDTAGLRDHNSCDIERIGMAKAMQWARSADFFLIVVDASSNFCPELPSEITQRINCDNSLLVLNKIDLPKCCAIESFLPSIERLEISLKFAESPHSLKEKICEIISRNDELSCDIDLVVNARHVEILQKVNESLTMAKSIALNFGAAEIIASEIRRALEVLGEVTGAFNVEKVLDLIFANFCVGK